MQSKDSACPRCASPLRTTFCGNCGYIIPQTETDKQHEKNGIRLIVGLSVLMVLGFTQLAMWGNHAVEIRLLQLADKTGLASMAQLERMAMICTELKKRECVEHAYLRQSQMDKKNSAKLAEYLISRKRYPEALKILKAYMTINKKDLNAHLLYADTLTEMEKYDEATGIYEYLISKSQGLPSDAAKNYVKCLARAKRFEAAENVIYKIRRTYREPKKFMDGELRVLAALKSAQPLKVQ